MNERRKSRQSEPELAWEDEGGSVSSDERARTAVERGAPEEARAENQRARLGLPMRARVRLTDAYDLAARAAMTADARRLLWQLDKLKGHAGVDAVLDSSGMGRVRTMEALLELRELHLVTLG